MLDDLKGVHYRFSSLIPVACSAKLHSKEFKDALDYLNYVRNLYYKAASGTEQKEIADALNEVLPTIAKMLENEV